MKVSIVILLLVSTIGVVLGDQVRYDNFTVYRITPRTESAAQALHSFEENPMGFEFWRGPTTAGRPVDIMIPPHLNPQFQDMLATGLFDSEVFVKNVQELIDNEQPKTRSLRFGWTEYQTLDQINAWLIQLANSDSRVTLIKGGTSHEGRELLGVKVVFASGNSKRGVFIEANIHAREWITSATATWILNTLLTSTDSKIRQIANTHDWYIFPVTNPDGFEYSRTTNRMWRKTRVPYLLCAGADPNRNWGYQWGTGGSSSSACSDTYAGPRAFSEPSTKSLSEYITSIASNLRAYIALHSYSQLLLLPYGNSNAKLDNYNDLYSVGLKAATSLASRYGTRYSVGNIVDLLYVASGGSMDWVKGTFKIPITYTYELRDTGSNGFILPANQIVPTSQETLDSIVTILQEFNAIL